MVLNPFSVQFIDISLIVFKMVNYDAIERKKEEIGEKIKAYSSKYSESLRHRLDYITDYKKTFEKVFEGFIENDLV